MVLVLRRAAILAALFLNGPTGALAHNVTLTSRDGLIRLQSTLESRNGAYFSAASKIGLLTLGAQVQVVSPPY